MSMYTIIWYLEFGAYRLRFAGLIPVRLIYRSPVFEVENQRWGNCTSALGHQTGGFGPWSLFM